MSGDTTGTELNRRRVLSSLAAGAVAAGVGAGAASAESTASAGRPRAVRTLDETEWIGATYEEYAGGVLETLVDEGYLSDASVAGLPTDEIVTGADRATPGTRLFRKEGLGETELRVVPETDGPTVEVVVKPERGEAFAFVEADGDRVVVGSDSKVTTSGCTSDFYCVDENECGSNSDGVCTEYEEVCCFSGGTTSSCTTYDNGCKCYCTD